MPLLMTGLLTKAVPLAVRFGKVAASAIVIVRYAQTVIETVDTLNRGVKQVRKRANDARKDAQAPDDDGNGAAVS